MVQYVMLMNYKADGIKTIRSEPERLQTMEDAVTRFEGKVLGNFHLLGEYDHCLIIDAPDNFKAYRGALEQELSATAETAILPAINVPLFKELMQRNFKIEGPHRWQIQWWAKFVRMCGWWYANERHVYEYCKPRTITGTHHFDRIRGACIVVGNHTSMADSMLLLHALPARIRYNIFTGAAADRWFIKRKGRKELLLKPWYQSMIMGTFPIQRGGGSRALDYSHWLLAQGQNLLIFPEGTRSTSRSMAKFKHGVSILALEHDVPVVPCYITGMNKVRPKGKGQMQPAPVTASFLEPIRFAPGTPVPDATRQLYEALNTVHKAVQDHGVDAAFEASNQRGPAFNGA